jgi:hypothetical protein
VGRARFSSQRTLSFSSIGTVVGLSPVASALLEVEDAARRFPTEVSARVVEVLPGGTAVAGLRDYFRARQAALVLLIRGSDDYLPVA